MTQHTDEVPAAVERAFSAVDSGTPVDQIIGRGRRLRGRRRKLAGGLLAVAAAAALAVPLSHAAAGGGQHASAQASAAPGVQVDLAAWSVHTNPNGTVSITVRQMHDPAGLRQTLAKAGIPAVVAVDHLGTPSTCVSHGGQVPKDLPKGIVTVTKGTPGAPGVTIRPAAIPKGDTVYFVITMHGTRPSLIIIAIFQGTPPTCSS